MTTRSYRDFHLSWRPSNERKQGRKHQLLKKPAGEATAPGYSPVAGRARGEGKILEEVNMMRDFNDGGKF